MGLKLKKKFASKNEGLKIFCIKQVCFANTFGPKNILGPTCFGLKQKLVKKTFGPKNVWIHKFLTCPVGHKLFQLDLSELDLI